METTGKVIFMGMRNTGNLGEWLNFLFWLPIVLPIFPDFFLEFADF